MTAALSVSVLGVSIGIILLIVVLSIMSGFLLLFQDKYTQITSELVVLPRLSQTYSNFHDKLNQVKGVAASTPIVMGQAMILKTGVGGVVLEGIDLKTAASVTDWNKIWSKKPIEINENENWIWVGEKLAAKIKVNIGDTVKVLIPKNTGNTYLDFKVTTTTHFGIYEHDMRYAYIDINYLKKIFGREKEIPIYKVKTIAGSHLETVADSIKHEFGMKVNTRLWSDLNQNVFKAVENQKMLLFLVLEIVIGLSAMNVINLLLMSVHFRKRDIAILRAMGIPLSKLFIFFLGQGMIVALLGIGFGVSFGYLICYILEQVQPALLSESIYNVTRLPFLIKVSDVLMISGSAFLLCCVFSVIPAIRAARLRPTEVLRYE